MRCLFLLCVVIGLATACGESKMGPTPDTRPAKGASESKEPGHRNEVAAKRAPTEGDLKSLFGAHMQHHFQKTEDIRTALISGDLVAARKGADWFVEHVSAEGMPEPLQPYAGPMRLAANRIVTATPRTDKEFHVEDLALVGEAVATMGATCGQCHTEAKAEVKVAEPRPPVGEDVKAIMGLHERAADMMWTGLIGPDEKAWGEGAKALLAARLTPEEIAGSKTPPPAVEDLAKRVYSLAKEARGEQSPARRVEKYGEILASCAECHHRLGKGPGDPFVGDGRETVSVVGSGAPSE